MLKKILLLLIFSLIVQGLSFASAKGEPKGSPVNFRQSSTTNQTITNFDTNSVDINRSSRNLIKLGKALTFAGIGGFVGGSAILGVSFVPFFFALYYSGLAGSIGDITEGSYNIFFTNIGNMTPGVLALLGTTLFLWVLGPMLMGLLFLIIPGIICWARGASLRKKSRVSIAPLTDTPGISIRFN